MDRYDDFTMLYLSYKPIHLSLQRPNHDDLQKRWLTQTHTGRSVILPTPGANVSIPGLSHTPCWARCSSICAVGSHWCASAHSGTKVSMPGISHRSAGFQKVIKKRKICPCGSADVASPKFRATASTPPFAHPTFWVLHLPRLLQSSLNASHFIHLFKRLLTQRLCVCHSYRHPFFSLDDHLRVLS